MKQLRKLNIEQSLKKGKLCFETSWWDKSDLVFIYFLFCGISLVTFMFLLEMIQNEPQDNIIPIILMLIPMLLGIYGVYRKATENCLLRISTSSTKLINRKLLLDYAEQESLQIYRNSTSLLIFKDLASNIFNNDKKNLHFHSGEFQRLFCHAKGR